MFVAHLAIGLAFTTTLLLAGARSAQAGRCQSQIGFTGGLHCGLDSDPSPPHPEQACTEAAMQNLPNKCEQGSMPVVYDLDKPWPLDGQTKSTATIRADRASPCAAMGEKTVPITGFAVGCWSPPDKEGCRVVKFLNGGSMCLHIQHALLGDGCTDECARLSTEQIAISNAGAAEHFVCPPLDETVSCRSTRHFHEEKFRLWFGGYCSTNGCDNPGVDPRVGDDTCVSQWGASYLGYARGKSKALGPGHYDWRSGAFKVNYRNGRATCGKLGQCLRASSHAPWDLSIIAVPRSSAPPPCVSATSTCNPEGCTP